MTDTAQARRMMVDAQIRANDVTDLALVQAFLDVPKEIFLPADKRSIAYLDMDIPVGTGRVIIQPMVLARLLQAANIGPSEKVLDVGSASGYSAAVIARIAGEVVALESDASLAAEAERLLAGTPGVRVVAGPLEGGHAAGAPYDVIVLEGAAEVVPPALFAQLKEGGRLVAVVGRGRSGRATVFVKSPGDVTGREVFDAASPVLPGFAKAPVFTF